VKEFQAAQNLSARADVKMSNYDQSTKVIEKASETNYKNQSQSK